MIRYRSIELGMKEKHLVEFRTTPFTGFEQVLIDGTSVLRKRALFGIDQTFEVGLKEKHLVRVKSGALEHLGLEPIFFVDGIPFEVWQQKQNSPDGDVKSSRWDRYHAASLLLRTIGYIAWPVAAVGMIFFFRHRIKEAIFVLMHLVELKG